MAYNVQHREYEFQMNNLFHHSLIKIIVLHHLKQLKIARETFIEAEVLTSPPNEPARPIPPSSLVSQKQTRLYSRATVNKCKKDKEFKTYQRGHRQVFAPQIVEGALPSTSTKQGYHK